MPSNLRRYQQEGDDHFITFSCYGREPYLNTPSARDTFLKSLEFVRKRYNFEVLGYVVMPEHVHLLVSESRDKPLATAIQALKLSVSKLMTPRPFWLTRYYDFNVFSHNKLVEKLHYMHMNPVERGLVSAPESWPYSTYRHYTLNEPTPVQITHPESLA
jgi:putative transposase